LSWSWLGAGVRIAYADPPYPGMSHFYRDHPDYGGEVDHRELLRRLDNEYDGWVLHTASTTLAQVLALCPDGVRVGAWVKPFASFKPGVQVAYAWEPVIFAPARVDTSKEQLTVRDWISEPITLKKGLTGVKPQAVCEWAFRIVGAQPDDELDDLYPGSGAIARAWDAWSRQLTLAALPVEES
jgi:hypothetical protein